MTPYCSSSPPATRNPELVQQRKRHAFFPLSSFGMGRKLQEKVSLLNCERILKFELGMSPFLFGFFIPFPPFFRNLLFPFYIFALIHCDWERADF
uniref:Uncharacterized protein n=1 Tax=Solanum tuberosum TaxID=4113 RepID=M1AB18_SOLTU